MLAKVSLLVSYWSLYDGSRKLKPYFAAFVALFLISHVMMFFWGLFGCVPMQERWSVTEIRALVKARLNTFDESTVGQELYAGSKCEEAQDAMYALDLFVDFGMVGWAVPPLRNCGLGRWDTPGLVILCSLLAFAVVGKDSSVQSIRYMWMSNCLS